MATPRKLLFLLALGGVPSAEGFMPKVKKSKTLRPDHLSYIAGGHEASVVLPISQASHKRQGKWQPFTVNKPKQSSSEQLRKAPSEEGRSINNRHSSSDWLYNLKTLPNSSVLREVKGPVLTLTAWATIVSVVHRLLLWKGKTQLAANMALPLVAHSLLVSSLGLLLVFRTNSSYQRFLEGRKIWERILTTSRNLSRLATLYRDDIGTEGLARIKNLIASFPYLLRHHIRSGCLCSTDPDSLDDRHKLHLQDPQARCIDTRYEGDNFSQQGQRTSEPKKCLVDRRDMPWCLLDDPKRDTLEKIARSTNRPLWICDRLGLEITKIPYNNSFSSRERLTLLKSVDELAATIGQCERIRTTAVPLNYARHALRSLTLWLFTLPFCMVKDLGLLTGPATAVMAWVLFGVYQIGYSIEDPFQKSLRLSILCDAIRRDVLGNDDDLGSRDSAFYIEEDDEDDFVELREPHSLKGLNGKEGDFLAEADIGIFLNSPSIGQPLVIDSAIFNRQRTGRSTLATVADSLKP